MNKFAEKLASWFGSGPFIIFHIIWFVGWVIVHFTLDFDPEWSALTLVVSLEAIFLSLFILRAEHIQGERFEHKVDSDLKTSDQTLAGIETIKRALRQKK